MSQVNLAEALNRTLDHALAELEHVVILGQDVASIGGMFGVTSGLAAKYGIDRVIDTPVSESGTVGVGLGLAIAGMCPVLELPLIGLSYSAFNQIATHVSRIRNRSRHRFTAPLVIRVPFGGGTRSPEHHSDSMEAIYAHVPGLKVLVPSTPVDAAGLLRSAIEDPDPVLFFEPARLYRSIAQELPAQAIRAPIGVASVSRGGSQVTILTWGSMVRDAITAADQVENDGVSVEVLDLRSLVPLDINAITDSVAKTGRAIVLHEAPRTGGFGADVAAQIQEHCFSLLKSPVRRITGWDTVFPLRLSEHLYMPSVERISSIVKQVVLE